MIRRAYSERISMRHGGAINYLYPRWHKRKWRKQGVLFFSLYSTFGLVWRWRRLFGRCYHRRWNLGKSLWALKQEAVLDMVAYINPGPEEAQALILLPLSPSSLAGRKDQKSNLLFSEAWMVWLVDQTMRKTVQQSIKLGAVRCLRCYRRRWSWQGLPSH